MRKIICGFLLFCSITISASALSAKSAIVIDADTGAVLSAHNAEERLPMASTTKIMTALVALSEGDLDRTYQVKKEYTMIEGSSMYLKEGEEITMRDTLYGLMLSSGNDAAVAIAGECGGLKNFIEKMNAKAAELGLQNTHFENPNGLDSETHYTTAHELALIASAAMKDPVFREIVATIDYTSNGRSMHNHNRLLSMYDGAIGIKTGYTKRSGRTLVSAAERNGRTLICVTLSDPDDWNDHMTMLDSAFEKYSEVTLHNAGDELYQQKVLGGDIENVPLAAQNTVTAYLAPGEKEKIETVRFGETICYAPVVKTAIAGQIVYRIGDKVIAKDTLLYGQGSVLLPEQKSWTERLAERIFGN